MKLTPWYPGHVKPARPGVYERVACSTPYYARWDGRQWYCGHSDPRTASLEALPSLVQIGSNNWRGLAEELKS